MAQVVGFDKHRYNVASFVSAFVNSRSRLISIADACAKTGKPPELISDQPSELGYILMDFAQYVLPAHTLLVPPGFPEPDHEDVEAMAIAADFWEEQGNLKNANRLRIRLDCILTCQEILIDAFSQWCLGHPEDPSTEEVLDVLVDELHVASFLNRPYGVKCWIEAGSQ